MPNKEKSWTEYFRVITPFLLLVLNFSAGSIIRDLDKIDGRIIALDTKVFHHLTNEDIHIPRGQLVTRDRFDEYEKSCNITNERILQAIKELKIDIKQRDAKL